VRARFERTERAGLRRSAGCPTAAQAGSLCSSRGNAARFSQPPRRPRTRQSVAVSPLTAPDPSNGTRFATLGRRLSNPRAVVAPAWLTPHGSLSQISQNPHHTLTKGSHTLRALDAIIRRSAVDEQYETRTRRERLMMRFVGRLVVVGALVGCMGMVEAATLIAEPFNQSGTMGTGVYSSWSSASGSGNQLVVSAANGLEFGASDRDYRQTFASQTGAVYFGIDIAPQTLPSSGSDYAFALSDGGSYVGRFFLASANSGSNYNLGVSVNSGSSASTSTSNFGLEEQRIVGSYNPSNGEISMWAGSLVEGSPLLTVTGSTAPEIDGFNLRQAGSFDNGASSIFMKDLIVSDDFATAAAVVPEPSCFAFAGLGLAAVAWRLRRRG
jgi:hypothetical protein